MPVVQYTIVTLMGLYLHRSVSSQWLAFYNIFIHFYLLKVLLIFATKGG